MTQLKNREVKCECGWVGHSFRPEKSLATHKSSKHKPNMLLETFLVNKFIKFLQKPTTQKRIVEMYLESFKERR